MQKFNLELDNEIKKYHDSFEKKEQPKIREVGKFGEDGWSISIGDIDDENTKDWNKRGLRSKNKNMVNQLLIFQDVLMPIEIIWQDL